MYIVYKEPTSDIKITFKVSESWDESEFSERVETTYDEDIDEVLIEVFSVDGETVIYTESFDSDELEDSIIDLSMVDDLDNPD
jgi:hypothetical protein